MVPLLLHHYPHHPPPHHTQQYGLMRERRSALLPVVVFSGADVVRGRMCDAPSLRAPVRQAGEKVWLAPPPTTTAATATECTNSNRHDRRSSNTASGLGASLPLTPGMHPQQHLRHMYGLRTPRKSGPPGRHD